MLEIDRAILELPVEEKSERNDKDDLDSFKLLDEIILALIRSGIISSAVQALIAHLCGR
jgi:hypothetical protein